MWWGCNCYRNWVLDAGSISLVFPCVRSMRQRQIGGASWRHDAADGGATWGGRRWCDCCRLGRGCATIVSHGCYVWWSACFQSWSQVLQINSGGLPTKGCRSCKHPVIGFINLKQGSARAFRLKKFASAHHWSCKGAPPMLQAHVARAARERHRCYKRLPPELQGSVAVFTNDNYRSYRRVPLMLQTFAVGAASKGHSCRRGWSCCKSSSTSQVVLQAKGTNAAGESGGGAVKDDGAASRPRCRRRCCKRGAQILLARVEVSGEVSLGLVLDFFF
jgi:hypothetical protein